jgi:hypothetical protein
MFIEKETVIANTNVTAFAVYKQSVTVCSSMSYFAFSACFVAGMIELDHTIVWEDNLLT